MSASARATCTPAFAATAEFCGGVLLVLGLDLAGTGWALGALAAGILGGAGAVAGGKRYGRRGAHRAPYAHA